MDRSAACRPGPPRIPPKTAAAPSAIPHGAPSWRRRCSPSRRRRPPTRRTWTGPRSPRALGRRTAEEWCEPPDPGTSIAGLQGAPLAIIPYEAIHCTVDQILAEGVAAGIPARATYEVNTLTDTGREQLAIVVNALETPEQQRDYERWTQIRALMTTQPGQAQDLLESFGADVKMPIFIEANIHGGEREGADAMLQVLRDLVTTPYGEHPVVDDVLDHSIVIIIPSQNPDGRYLGTRANSNGFDMNRDLLVQSQPEIRANIRLQQEWLAPVMFAMHGYVNPTLIDGLTKPHNPGLEYDIFANWNQRRLDENELDFALIEQSLTRPVNDYGPNGGQQASIAATNGATQSGTTVSILTTGSHGLSVGQEIEVAGVGEFAYNGEVVVTSIPAANRFTYELAVTGLAPSGQGVVFTGSPATAEGWDDWGPFYTQTYGAFFGVDGSTLEMCSNASCGGRLGSKTAQYLGFYSSADYWLANRLDILHDQLTIAIRNVTNAPRVACCDAPFLAERGFDAENHDWMVPYPKAFVIPSAISPGGKPLAFDDGQRSQSESNRLAQWLLDNGVALHRTTRDYVYGGQTIAKHSYVVYMNQFMRGFAYTSLAAGQDISDRITQLYAPPGAWSHGQLWGADTIEVPASATFAPKTEPITDLNPQVGGLRGGGKVDWYALAIRGNAETRAVLDLLRDGVDGEIAEAAFTSASAGQMPAGSVLFANTAGEFGRPGSRRPREPVSGSSACSALQAGHDAARRSAADRGPRQHRHPGHQRHHAQPAADLRLGRPVRLDDPGDRLVAECRREPARRDRRHLQHRPELPGVPEHLGRAGRGNPERDDGDDPDHGQPQPRGRLDRDRRGRRRGRIQRHVHRDGRPDRDSLLV